MPLYSLILMNTIIRKFVLFFFILALGGCGHLPYVSKSSLKPSIPGRPSIELDKDVSLQTRLGWNTGLAVGVTKGVYVPVFEAEGGVYYRGPDDCVVLINTKDNKIVDTRDGGFWLPRDPASKSLSKIYSHEFSGSRYRSPASGSSGDISTVATQIALNNPNGASPVAAGATGGIVGGVLGAMIENAKKEKAMVLMTDIFPTELLRGAIKKN